MPDQDQQDVTRCGDRLGSSKEPSAITASGSPRLAARSDALRPAFCCASRKRTLVCVGCCAHPGTVARPWVRRWIVERRLWAWMPYQGGTNRAWLLETLGHIQP